MKLSEKAEAALERAGALIDNADKRDDGLLRRIAGVEVKSIDEAKRTVDVVASSEAIDSYDEIVVQDWDLSRYAKNPTVLYLHNSGGGFCGPQTKETFPVGFATNVRMENGNLHATLNFVDEKASCLAPYCWEGFKQGSVRAVSVGFRPRDVKPGKVDGKDVYFLSGNELFEISVVPIGANPDAVALSHKRNVALCKARVAKATQPARTGQENTMDPEQIKKLQEELAAAKAAATAKDAEVTSLKTALQAKATECETIAKAKNDAVASLTTANAEHATKVAELEGKLKTETERADKGDSRIIELEVDALVGKKITPVEKDDMIALRKSNPTLFDSIMSKRADSKLTETVIPADPKQKSTSGDKSGASGRLAAAAAK